MSKEHSEWLASLPAAEREALNKGLSALETMADLWAVEINLGKMSETIAGAPDLKKRAFAIKSMVEQGFIEGAYRTYLDYKDGKLPGQSARPEVACILQGYREAIELIESQNLLRCWGEFIVIKLNDRIKEIESSTESPLARRGDEP